METKTFWEFRAENLPEVEIRNAKLQEFNDKLSNIAIPDTKDANEMIELYMNYAFNVAIVRCADVIDSRKWRIYRIDKFVLIWEVNQSGNWNVTMRRIIGTFEEKIGQEIVNKLVNAFK